MVPLGIEVRIGLHTGEIERDGDDIAGLGVVIAARIVAKAKASEVLVSQTVKDLVTGSGILFQDRGSEDLQGVPGGWHLYAAVRAEGEQVADQATEEGDLGT